LALEIIEEVKAPHLTTLRAFSRALLREAHVLTRQPDLLWQQLYNRLQWAGPPLAGHLAAERERRTRPWINRYTHLEESEALIRTFTGHPYAVKGCTVSPNGAWIVSFGGASEYTLPIWDPATGVVRATLAGHRHGVETCMVSPDGPWLVTTGGLDNTLKIWDAATGAERATLKGHTSYVKGCLVSPDTKWIVSWANDNTLRIWAAASGRKRALLTGHTDTIRDCTISPDGAWIASISSDHTLRIWDITTGTERAQLVLPWEGRVVVFHPFAPVVACGDMFGYMHLARLAGFDFGPLLVTAAAHDNQLTVRCPACQHIFQMEQKKLGKTITCPEAGCSVKLNLNPFVVQRADKVNQPTLP